MKVGLLESRLPVDGKIIPFMINYSIFISFVLLQTSAVVNIYYEVHIQLKASQCNYFSRPACSFGV